MKITTYLASSAIIGILLIGGVFAQGSKSSDLQNVADKYIPNGMTAAHPAVAGKFGPASSNSAGNIVVLYKEANDGIRYKGLVLVPDANSGYKSFELPEPGSVWSMMEPKAIFFANADGDAEDELFIIDECYTGIGPTGAVPFYWTRVYDWNGMGFVPMDALSEKIGTLNAAAKVPNRVRQLLRSGKTSKTQMYRSMDFSAHNQMIDKAAKAGEDWVKRPTQVVARVIGNFSDMGSRTIVMDALPAENAGSVIVTVLDDDITDDSIRTEKHRFVLKANDQGVWKFESAGAAWRCWADRGSQVLSAANCL